MQHLPWAFYLRKIRSVFVAFWSLIWRHPLPSLATFTLLFFLSSSCHSFMQFSADLQRNSLSLNSFSSAYVDVLNESISVNQPTVTPVAVNQPGPGAGTIPRIIHRTYKTTDIPPQWQEPYSSCRRLNPTYKEYFWTDEDARSFIETNFAWFLRIYDSYPYAIQRVDSLRYFLLWHYGGIYLDMDIGCRRPLDPLLDFAAVLPKTWPYGVSNDVMASTPQHPFVMKTALSLQDHNHHYLSKYITVFFTTGPMFLSAILARWIRMEQDGSLSAPMVSKIAILPSMMYGSTAYSFFAHYRGSSWHGNDAAVVRFMYRHL